MTPWTVIHLAPLSMRFSMQEYWSRLPFPPAGDLSNPGIKPASPALQVGSLPLSHWGIILYVNYISEKNIYTATPYSDTLSSVWFDCLVMSDSDPVGCSMPGLLAHTQSLIKLMSIALVMSPNHLSSSVVPFPSNLQPSPASGSFPMSQFFTSGSQSTGVSSLASVLPMNIQD